MCNRPYVFLAFLFIACTGLKKTMLTENPEFFNQAQQYVITSPLSYANKPFSKYIIEDPKTKYIYEIQPQFGKPESRRYELEPEYGEERIQEITKIDFSLLNPLDNKTYRIGGEKTSIRTREGNQDVIIGSARQESIIYEDDQQVGQIIAGNPTPGVLVTVNVIYPVEFTLHERKVRIEYQKKMNTKTMSFKDDTGLVAFFDLETKGLVASKYNGVIYINPELSDEFRSDLITMFVITDIVMSIREEIRL